MGYNGRRMSGSRSRSRRSESVVMAQTMARVLLFPVLLIVLIRFGVMTPSESGAFAVFYALIVGAFIYKELTLERFLGN